MKTVLTQVVAIDEWRPARPTPILIIFHHVSQSAETYTYRYEAISKAHQTRKQSEISTTATEHVPNRAPTAVTRCG